MDALSVILTSSVPSAKSEIKKYYYIQQSQVTAYKKHIIIIIHKEENIHTRYKHRKTYYYLHQYVARFMLVACNHITGYLLL